MRDIEKLCRDYRLTTAEILYHMPDHPMLLQSFTWQELDLVPDFPTLKRFLSFWERSIEGRLHSVKIASCEILQPAQWRQYEHEFRLH
jgi:uncharacterized protein Usg